MKTIVLLAAQVATMNQNIEEMKQEIVNLRSRKDKLENLDITAEKVTGTNICHYYYVTFYAYFNNIIYTSVVACTLTSDHDSKGDV